MNLQLKTTLITCSIGLLICAPALKSMQQAHGIKRTVDQVFEPETSLEKKARIATQIESRASSSSSMSSSSSSSSSSLSTSQNSSASASDIDGDIAMTPASNNNSSVERKVNAAATHAATTLNRIGFPSPLINLVKQYYMPAFNPWDYVEAFQKYNGIHSHTVYSIQQDFSFFNSHYDLTVINDEHIASLQGTEIRILDLAGKCIASLKDGESPIMALKKLKSKKIISHCLNGFIKIWDLTTNKCLFTRRISNAGKLEDVIELADGKITCLKSGTIELWDVTDIDSPILIDTLNDKGDDSFDTFRQNACAIIQLQDGRIASCSRNGTIKLWDLKSHTHVVLKSDYDSTSHKSHPVILQLKNGIIAARSDDGTIRIVDPITNTCIAHLKLPPSYSPIIQLSDSRIAFAADNKVIIWDLITHKCVATLEHDQHIINICLLNDGRILTQTSHREYGREYTALHIWAFDDAQIDAVRKGLGQDQYELIEPSLSASASSSSSSSTSA